MAQTKHKAKTEKNYNWVILACVLVIALIYFVAKAQDLSLPPEPNSTNDSIFQAMNSSALGSGRFIVRGFNDSDQPSIIVYSKNNSSIWGSPYTVELSRNQCRQIQCDYEHYCFVCDKNNPEVRNMEETEKQEEKIYFGPGQDVDPSKEINEYYLGGESE